MSATTFTQMVNYFRSGIPVVSLSSPAPEELTTLEKIYHQVAQKLPETMPVFVWDIGAGLRQVKATKKGTGINFEATGIEFNDPMSNPLIDMLDLIATGGVSDDETDTQHPFAAGIFVLLDIDQFISGDRMIPEVARRIKNLAFSLKRTGRRLVLMGVNVNLPDDFQGLVYSIENPLPLIDEVESAVTACIANMQSRFAQKTEATGQLYELIVDLSADERQRLLRACLGLTIEEILNALRLDMIERSRVDAQTVDVMTRFKTVKLERLMVEFYDKADVAPGGYVNFQRYAQQLTHSFSSSLQPNQGKLKRGTPKGSLLIGPSGTGKTLMARTVQYLWGVPALKLDIAAMYSGTVGGTEENIRQVLAIAESIAPCILVIDEFEKALSGATGHNGDSGTSLRMIGKLLQWMNDKTSAVYVIATANNIGDLLQQYPELFRRGRFDEIFYVGLPNASERAEIFVNHLAKQSTELSQKLLKELAERTDFCTGADIEKIVSDAVNTALSAGRDELLIADLLSAVDENPPQAKGNMQQITSLIVTAKDRGWKFASDPDSEKPATKRKAKAETDLNVMV